MNTMMEYCGYHAKVEYSAEDKLLVGEVFGIADSLNFHATSVEELEQMFHQCIDNYLENCRVFGVDPQREFRGSFNVRISQELHRQSALNAAKRGVSLNQYVVEALEQALKPVQPQVTTFAYPVVKQLDTTAWKSLPDHRYQNLQAESTIIIKRGDQHVEKLC